MNPLVAIVGPTAAGKSELAVRLAQDFNGEIVGADSRQIYRHMDIGTAKPTPEQMSIIPHHLIDIADPDDDFSLAQYQSLAREAITDIHRRGSLPLLVGGSGQYVWSVLEGWEIPRIPPDEGFRRSLEGRAAVGDRDGLYLELAEIDPAAARKIGCSNLRRIIRALEIYHATGTPPSQLQRKREPPFRTLIIGLTLDRTELYRRIDSRVDRMIGQGLEDEVRRLLGMGYGLELPAMSSIGYRQMGMFIRGEMTLAAAVERIKLDTHRVARHQCAWFSLKDSRIKWFDANRGNIYDEIKTLTARFLKGSAEGKN